MATSLDLTVVPPAPAPAADQTPEPDLLETITDPTARAVIQGTRLLKARGIYGGHRVRRHDYSGATWGIYQAANPITWQTLQPHIRCEWHADGSSTSVSWIHGWQSYLSTSSTDNTSSWRVEDDNAWLDATGVHTISFRTSSTGTITISQDGFELDADRSLERKLAPPPRQNHRGQHRRAEHGGRQFDDVSASEVLALQLLRRMVSPEQFRRYLKHGIVSTKGPSGLVYEVRRRATIRVWDKGVELATLCVHLVGEPGATIPPTDDVAAKLIMAECDELALWRRSNITWRVAAEARARPAVVRLGLVPITSSTYQPAARAA